MPSEISSKTRANGEDYSNVQREYKKKRKDLVENSEEELQSLKNRYERRIEQLESDKDAAIVHIKKATVNEVSSAQTQAEKKLQDTNEKNQRNLDSLQKYAASKRRSYDDTIRQTETNVEEKLQYLAEKEESKRKRLANDSRKFQEEQYGQMKKVREMSQAEIENLQDKHTERRTVARDKGEKDLREMNQHYAQLGQKTRESRETMLDKTREHNQKDMEALRARNSDRIQTIKRDADTTFKNNQIEIAKKTQKQEAQGEAKVSTVRDRYTDRLKHERTVGEERLNEQRSTVEKQSATIEKTSGERIDGMKKKSEEQIKTIKVEHQEELKREKAAYEAQRKHMTEAFNETFKRNNELQRSSMERQNQKFDEAFKKNALNQHQTIRNQEKLQNREIMDLKNDLALSTEKYAQRAEDPFYKIQGAGSTLREHDDAYVIRAYVPAHERDNVKVKVKENLATISGTRAFKEKVDDGDGKSMKTHSYQSFSEEFKLEKPVSMKSVRQEREGDYLKITIPKLV